MLDLDVYNLRRAFIGSYWVPCIIPPRPPPYVIPMFLLSRDWWVCVSKINSASKFHVISESYAKVVDDTYWSLLNAVHISVSCIGREEISWSPRGCMTLEERAVEEMGMTDEIWQFLHVVGCGFTTSLCSSDISIDQTVLQWLIVVWGRRFRIPLSKIRLPWRVSWAIKWTWFPTPASSVSVVQSPWVIVNCDQRCSVGQCLWYRSILSCTFGSFYLPFYMLNWRPSWSPRMTCMCFAVSFASWEAALSGTAELDLGEFDLYSWHRCDSHLKCYPTGILDAIVVFSHKLKGYLNPFLSYFSLLRL